ncbi:uncharacterized protein LOC6568631 [Drosophila grimshawi]|uniref:GH16323 n=1 Tax=Drosophila grimshawi TaxID=7222 RepID=B4JU88_DROGR|nr:uncharacterized protein LOC6568631 [Drosophila grimshawi]EDV91058.1 GH16323 [Drosophila grimshawi]
MSSHGYRTTTTVEYYEYEMPQTGEYIYQMMPYPFSNSCETCPVNYLSYVQDHLSMVGDNNYHSGLVFEMVPCRQRQTTNGYSEQDVEQPHSSYHPPTISNPRHEDEYETGNGDASATETCIKPNKSGKKKNIYRAKEGYLVEEPTSESEEDHADGTT